MDDGGNIDFSVCAAKLNEKYLHHARSLKDICFTKSVMKPTVFFESLQEEMQTIASRNNKQEAKEQSTVEDYAELFKIFEEYPTNLQKAPKKRDLQRTNSSILKGPGAPDASSVDISTAGVINVSASLCLTRSDEQRSASEVYMDFKKFQQKLRRVYEEATSADKAQDAYLAKVGELRTFAQQLEKLMPAERDAQDAFTTEEEAMLTTIAENMQQLNYLRENSLYIQSPNEIATGGNTIARLESLIEVLTYTLMQIGCYNNA
ncbi:augmin complex subunit msd5 [Scaptodrosophila lebanonensis]|uniref:Augmin complex subunit msd5 n=1 Tax=Drosophila lebanonensis TaxID=7225 RepID=A0A6J2UEB8_DROLE|nr:augmin complex subunit msd5 [Scaptodrosophila lebanonensis]